MRSDQLHLKTLNTDHMHVKLGLTKGLIQNQQSQHHHNDINKRAQNKISQLHSILPLHKAIQDIQHEQQMQQLELLQEFKQLTQIQQLEQLQQSNSLHNGNTKSQSTESLLSLLGNNNTSITMNTGKSDKANMNSMTNINNSSNNINKFGSRCCFNNSNKNNNDIDCFSVANNKNKQYSRILNYLLQSFTTQENCTSGDITTCNNNKDTVNVINNKNSCDSTSIRNQNTKNIATDIDSLQRLTNSDGSMSNSNSIGMNSSPDIKSCLIMIYQSQRTIDILTIIEQAICNVMSSNNEQTDQEMINKIIHWTLHNCIKSGELRE